MKIPLKKKKKEALFKQPAFNCTLQGFSLFFPSCEIQSFPALAEQI